MCRTHRRALNSRHSATEDAGSRQSGVFRSRLFKHRELNVGILPQRQEILIGAFRLYSVARKRERSSQLQARHRVHRIDEDDAAMIENPLKLADGFGGLTCREVRLAANVDRVQAAEASDEADAVWTS